jgi:hypothetical protein
MSAFFSVVREQQPEASREILSRVTRWLPIRACENRRKQNKTGGGEGGAMRVKNARVIGIAWYERETYAEVRGIMEDSEVLPREYDHWLRSARSVMQLEQARNSEVIKAAIDPDAFVAWCRATGQRADVRARTRHVNLAIEDHCNARIADEGPQPVPVAGDRTHPEAPAFPAISRPHPASG